MSYTLLESLKKAGFRENLDCSGLKLLNLEISVDKNAKKKLENMGVDVQKNMKIGDSLHSYYTTKITTLLKNAEISLAENGINGFIKWNEIRPQIVGLSISAFNVADSAQKLMSEKSFLLCSSGNSGAGTGYEQTDKWFSSIGACDNDFVMREYSSYGVTDIDFTGIDGYTVEGKQLLGTSYSRPYNSAISGQLYVLFRDLYGFFPAPMQIFNFMKKHTIDVAEAGFDNQSGYGVPYIPKDEDLKFFNIDIKQEILNSVKVVDNKIHVKDKIDLTESSNYNASVLAYVVRRHMDDNRLDYDGIVLNLDSMENDRFMEYIKFPSMMTQKLERGEA